MERLNIHLISNSLGFHGQPLQKVWEGERGERDLFDSGITSPDYSVYKIRQKHLTFQDRAKRLKLHQFIAKKANNLFDNSLVTSKLVIKTECVKGCYATIPFYEAFLNTDKSLRQRRFFDALQPGDIVYGTVISKKINGIVLKILCNVGKTSRYVADLNVKGFLPNQLFPLLAADKKNTEHSFNNNDYVICEIVEVVPDTDKMIVTARGSNPNIKYGFVQLDDFPENYKTILNSVGESYETLLENSSGFNNPYCIEVLSQELGLEIFEHYTNMSSLKGRFPQQEYSNELRQVQASKWAFRSVAEGIEHFKEGRHPEAFQCLNKALSIDPKNVEGLVARGALYANSGSFKKAVEDFETALKLNSSHANARKYMGETLVALGRSYEDENKIEDAKKAYQDCLGIIPHHEEAQNSLEFLKSKTGKQIVEPGELTLPALNINKGMDGKKIEIEASTSNKHDSKKDKKTKKKKSRANRRERKNSTSSSASESSESSDSSTESSSSSESSSSTDSDSNSHIKKKKNFKKSRQKSLSPLSKRMSLMNEETAEGVFHNNQFGDCSNPDSGLDDYELKVRKFLDITRDEDDYEEKVRKFVEEASKYRKERKILEEKAKKKKKKEARKLKKESKKRRREKDREEKKKAKLNKKNESKIDLDSIENKKIREALKLFENFPVLDELGTKLTSLLEKNNSGNMEQEMKVDRSGKSSQMGGNQMYDGNMEDAHASKWKMAFAKDSSKKKQEPPQPTGSKTIPKQYAFTNESDTDDDRDTGMGAPVQHPPPPPPPTAAPVPVERSRRRIHSPRSKYPENSQSSNAPAKSVVKSGPVVLDKFGNFRLANMETNKPPEPPGSPRRNSRSRSRSRPARKYSSSRSRSPRKRSRSASYARKYSHSRSRSRSFRSRTRSRTPRSRSYSRSRSRSRSLRRYGNDRRNFRGRGSYNDRGTYYQPRFNNNSRGRARGNYRDYRDYRGGRDRGRPFRPRAARGGNRYYRNYRDDSRERRYSRDRSEERDRRSYSNDRPRSPIDDNRDGKKSPMLSHPHSHSTDKKDSAKETVRSSSGVDVEGKWADSKAKSDLSNNIGQDVSLEEMEKYISKVKKENKEDMIERNKDILKKSNTSW